MAYCDSCGNFDENYDGILKDKKDPSYQPDLYYYWDAPLDEDYDWRDAFPLMDCLRSPLNFMFKVTMSLGQMEVTHFL